MSSPVSAGDVIAVSILIKDVIKALDDSRGSSADYQKAIHELWTLDRALLEVEHLSRTCDTTVELNALRYAAKRAAEQCRLHISVFLTKIKSYDSSLGAGGSGSRLRDAAKKVQWTFAQRDELAKFQTEVNGHISAINMLLITASISYMRLTGRNVESRMEESDRKYEASSDEVLSTLSNIGGKLQSNSIQLEEHGKQLDAQRQAGDRLVDGMRYFTSLSIDLKRFMTSILAASHHSYKVLLDVQSRVPREFKPCWIQEPVVFTDPLGRIAPIHLELINSWDVFDTVLAARFINLPGNGKIARNEVVFQDRYLAEDIERSQPFESCFLPGRHIDMSMVFEQKDPCTSCPKCGLKTDIISGRAIQCTSCRLWYQRIKDLGDDSADESPANSSACSQMGNMQSGNRASKKRKRDVASRDEEDNIRAFQRVRVLLKLNKLNSNPHSDVLKRLSCAPLLPQTLIPSLESMRMANHISNWPVESLGDEMKPTQLTQSCDLYGFRYREDWTSPRYQTHVGSSGGLVCDALFKSNNISRFPNPYTNFDFYNWLFEEQDTNNAESIPDPSTTQSAETRGLSDFWTEGDSYLSTLIASTHGESD